MILKLHRSRVKLFSVFLITSLPLLNIPAQDDFSVCPYLQNPTPEGITIIWFTTDSLPGQLSFRKNDTEQKRSIQSVPVRAQNLAYPEWENINFFGGNAPSAPFRHRVKLENLMPSTDYEYSVKQGNSTFTSVFATAPRGKSAVRIIFYSDCETEPESVNYYTDWPDPLNDNPRLYLLDQYSGYRNNLEVMRTREPDLIFIAGDLVESGGEQRDWDEFWRNNTSINGEKSLAGRIPIFAAPGNHEYYEGPYLGGYNQPGSERAIKRFLTYFETPRNNSPKNEQEGRFYSVKYGPVSFIVLDACNGGPNKSNEDTNFYLLGESDQNGGNSPDLTPGSYQYKWLEMSLKEAQIESLFTFVIFHHSPYSSGPHGYPPGETENTDNQSGYPIRSLTDLFMRYGVDAVISGHDELWERSQIMGTELVPGHSEEEHTIQFYDVGTGGDGLRGPESLLTNYFQRFSVHEYVPEIWENGILTGGGKHYGHLEIDIEPENINKWNAILRPVYVFPLFNASDGLYSGYERRVYDDEVVLTWRSSLQNRDISRCYPNPFKDIATIEYYLTESCETSIIIYNLQGQKIRLFKNENAISGFHTLNWNGTDERGKKAPPGVYFYRIKTEAGIIETKRMILLN